MKIFIKKWHVWTATAVAIIAVVAVALCAKPWRTFEKIEASKLLKVAVPSADFRCEMIEKFAEQKGWEVQFFEQNDLNRSISGLNSGKYDLILQPLPTTLPLKKRVAFTEPILLDRLVLVQKSGKKLLVNNIFDLEGETIYIEKHSPYKPHLQHIKKEFGVNFAIKTIKNATTDSLLTMVAGEEIKFAACSELSARKYKKNNANIDFSTKLTFRQQHAWALHKKNEQLKHELDLWINQFLQKNQEKR